MALALATTLLDHAGYSSHGLMTRLGQWLQTGHFASQGKCVGIGRSTRAAIRRFIATGQAQWIPDEAAAAGSGSLCRLAPVALAFLHQPALAEHVARQQSFCTHASPETADACAYFVTLLRHLILSPGTAHSSAAGPCIAQMAPGRFVSQPRSLHTGQVFDTLDLALRSLHRTHDFDAAVSSATACGGDAVSIGAVVGMLAGARYGYSAIPMRWLNRLARRNHIRSLGHDLLGTPAC
jgi:ADP-ribosyl-[dinitrogen reductase] hydrolase